MIRHKDKSIEVIRTLLHFMDGLDEDCVSGAIWEISGMAGEQMNAILQDAIQEGQRLIEDNDRLEILSKAILDEY